MLDDRNIGHRAWEVLVLLATVFLAVELPHRLVLNYDLPGTIEAYWISTALLIVDALLHQLRAQLVRKWARACAPGPSMFRRAWWLSVDILGAIPFRIVPGAGWLEVLRLLKLARVGQLIGRWRQHFLQHGTTLLLGFFVFWLLLI